MALASVAYTLWQEFLRYDPQLPIWSNRDRFVLSVGHASVLLYSLNRPGYELFNYDVYALCGDGDIMGASRSRRRLTGRTPRSLQPPLDLCP